MGIDNPTDDVATDDVETVQESDFAKMFELKLTGEGNKVTEGTCKYGNCRLFTYTDSENRKGETTIYSVIFYPDKGKYPYVQSVGWDFMGDGQLRVSKPYYTVQNSNEAPRSEGSSGYDEDLIGYTEICQEVDPMEIISTFKEE